MEPISREPVISREECTASVRHIRDALYVLNGKWKLPLIFSLTESSKRFGELQRVLDGITPKVLVKELKELELNGFVLRKVYPTTPVTVIYEVTPYAGTLHNVLNELKEWGYKHREKIKSDMRK
ncbi:winged helix-turn-helix transcriptional regulator [Arcticibacter sp.]|jgi:DNA-binding HxlR family transcriptional regulator|uniref:winged helix-turn-helix transcriptional regulator n=1 Tax=Arcticibacter sp. TaxID=1872630 RepID=UPI00388F3200